MKVDECPQPRQVGGSKWWTRTKISSLVWTYLSGKQMVPEETERTLVFCVRSRMHRSNHSVPTLLPLSSHHQLPDRTQGLCLSLPV